MKPSLLLTVALVTLTGGMIATWGASSSTSYKIPAEVIASGGGRSASTSYTQTSTIGESFIGNSTAGSLVMRAGFQASLASDAVITGNVTLAADDTTYEGLPVRVAAGATLTILGQHQFAALIVEGTITHARGDSTGVNLVVDGAVVIEAGGSIDVSGRGLRGGRQNGNGSYQGEWWNNGSPAASPNGVATYGETMPSANPLYGDALAPNELGSGGSANQYFNDVVPYGGNGGGRLFLTAQSLQVNGGLYADGGGAYYNGNGGSGGAIRVVLNGGTFSGEGVIQTAGGSGTGGDKRPGGSGRIAIAGFSANNFIGTFGRAGSIFLRPAVGGGELRLDNTTLTILNGQTLVLNSIAAGANGPVTIQNNGTLEMATDQLTLPAKVTLVQDGQLKGTGRADNIIGGLTVQAEAVITHTRGLVNGLQLNVAGPVIIDQGGYIDVSGRGLRGGHQDGMGSLGEWWNNGSPAANSSGRATYGEAMPSANPLYGDATAPNELGSGGSSGVYGYEYGGHGGGRLFLTAQSLQVNGGIYADGGGANSGNGGSGGAIRVVLNGGTFSGGGVIQAAGSAGSGFGSRGGGGRIALTGFAQNLFSGQLGPSGTTYLLALDLLADDDGDGMSNGDEIIAGTDPKDAQSILKLVVLRENNSVRLQFSSVVTRFYQIQWRTSLSTGSWQPLGNEMDGTGETVELTHPSNDANQKFYRVTVR